MWAKRLGGGKTCYLSKTFNFAVFVDGQPESTESRNLLQLNCKMIFALFKRMSVEFRIRHNLRVLLVETKQFEKMVLNLITS